jgi:aspartokinase
MIIADEANADSRESYAPCVKGITGKKGFTAFRVYKNEADGGAHLLTPLFAAAARRGVTPDFALTSLDAATLYFGRKTNAAAADAAFREALTEINADESSITEDVTLIAVVGSGVGADPGAAAKVVQALADTNITSLGTCFSVSNTNIIIAVANQDYEAALKSIYSKFS